MLISIGVKRVLKRDIMGKSQETQQLSVGMSGKWEFGGYRSYYGFFLGRTPQLTAGFFTCRKRHAFKGKYVFQHPQSNLGRTAGD
jgi:hypothetical protein